MMKFKIENQKDKNGEVREYAVFEDGTKKPVSVSEQYGKKYFKVDNKFNTTEKNKFLARSFDNRIKDAIMTIKNGDGDALLQEHGPFSFTFDKVVYFIDREFGEEMKRKSIEGWKDTEFAWCVKYGNKNSFYNPSPINPEGRRVSIFDDDKTPKMFDTEEEAKKYIEELLSKSAEYARELSKKVLAANGDKDLIMNAIGEVFDKIDEEVGVKDNVITDFVSDMVDGNGVLLSDDCHLNEIYFKIAQCIKTLSSNKTA